MEYFKPSKMKRPENIIGKGKYVEPYSFNSDHEQLLFESYIEHIKYIDFLESKKQDPELREKVGELVEAALVIGARRGARLADEFITHDHAKELAVHPNTIKHFTDKILSLFPNQQREIVFPTDEEIRSIADKHTVTSNLDHVDRQIYIDGFITAINKIKKLNKIS